MKKFALGTTALLALASPLAHAQSSVTLYGIIDAGVTYFSNLNGHSAFVANDGSIQSNRWGLRGIEDIGGGSRIIFDLENGFNLYSGTMVQSGVLFSRQAWLGIDNPRYGRFTLGKQYDFFWTISRSLQWDPSQVSTPGIPAISITSPAHCTSTTQSSTHHRTTQDSRRAHCMHFLPSPYPQEQDA